MFERVCEYLNRIPLEASNGQCSVTEPNLGYSPMHCKASLLIPGCDEGKLTEFIAGAKQGVPAAGA